MGLGNVGEQPIPVKSEVVRVEPETAGAIRLWFRFLHLVIVLAYNPVAAIGTALAALTIAGNYFLGPWVPPSLGIAALASVGLVTYKRPQLVRERVAGYGRAFKYRRKWVKTLRNCDVLSYGKPPPIPLSVYSTANVDKIRFKFGSGMIKEDFEDDHALRLAGDWGALAVRTYTVNVKWRTGQLWVLRKDPLVRIVEPFPEPLGADPLPKRIEVARREDGQPFSFKTRGAAHLLLAGLSDSGKSSALWAIVEKLHRACMGGKCQIWGSDPKWVELSMGAHLFHRLVYTVPDTLRMLEDAVAIMDRRNKRLQGFRRQHTPKVGEPLLVIILDEMIDLLEKASIKLKNRIANAIKQLLRKGRSASIWVIGAAQEVKKTIIEFRDQFVFGACFKVKSKFHADMVLGEGARAAGAYADKITDEEQGVSYVSTQREIIRVRWAYVTDERIKNLIAPPGAQGAPKGAPVIPDDLQPPDAPEKHYIFLDALGD